MDNRYEAAVLKLLREAQGRRERAEWDVRYWECRLGELYQMPLALRLEVDGIPLATPSPAD